MVWGYHREILCFSDECVMLSFPSAVGKTVGSYLRRDCRGDESEILAARLIDRPIRPMIADGWQHDTQLLAWLLSYDKQNNPEPLAICAASAAMAISEVSLLIESFLVCTYRVNLLSCVSIFTDTHFE